MTATTAKISRLSNGDYRVTTADGFVNFGKRAAEARAYAEAINTDTHATEEPTMTETATTDRYYAARQDGRYRVLSKATGQIIATLASKTKAEEKAAKLNAEEPWGTPEVPPMVECADDTCCGEPAAHLSPEPFTAQLQAEASAKRGLSPEAVAVAAAALDEVTMATPDEAAAQLAAEATRPFTVGGRLAEAAINAASLADGTLAAKLADRKATKDGTRRVHLTFIEAAALTQVAKNLELWAREQVADGHRSAVSLVFSCTQAQANLAKLFAGPTV